MLEYHYVFTRNGVDYHVYAPSKECATEKYLEENDLESLPKGTTVTRYND
jgi:hypothetical protein